MQEKLKKNLGLSIEQGSDKALGGAILWYQTRTHTFPGASLPPSAAGATDAAHRHPQDHRKSEPASLQPGDITAGPRCCKVTQAPPRRKHGMACHASHDKAFPRAQPPFVYF